MDFYKVHCYVYKRKKGCILVCPAIISKLGNRYEEEMTGYPVIQVKENPLVNLPDFDPKDYERYGYLLLFDEKDLKEENKVTDLRDYRLNYGNYKISKITDEMYHNSIKHVFSPIKKLIKRK